MARAGIQQHLSYSPQRGKWRRSRQSGDLLQRLEPLWPCGPPPPEGEDEKFYGLATTPPAIGSATPVVVGNVSGRPFSERTAR